MTNLVGGTTSVAEFALAQALLVPLVKRTIGVLLPDVTIRERHTDELEITEHPVETGTVIADHAFRRPAEVVIECGFSKSLASDLNSTYDKVRALQDPPQLINVVTGKRLYKNMLVKVVTVETDKDTENVLFMTITLREVFLVKTQEVTVPADPSNQASAATTQATTDSGIKQPVAVSNPPRT